MFAYVLIAAELAILYSVFWYVFVREPRPFELKENLWGFYDGPAQPYVERDYDEPQVAGFISGRSDSWLQELPSAGQSRRQQIQSAILGRSTRPGACRRLGDSDLKNGWTVREAEGESETSPESFLQTLGEMLNLLTVRTP